MRKSIFTSLLLSLMMLLLLSTFVITIHVADPQHLIASTIWAFFLTIITFIIYRTGKISTCRSMFFIIYAFAFILIFIAHLYETRGGMAITDEVIANRDVPLCPVAIPSLIVPAALKQVVIFPVKLTNGPFGGFYPILFMWLLSVFTLGRGWCSWGCFYGGIDECFSKLRRTPLIKSRNMKPTWRYFPFALLVVIIFWAFLAMEPVYCQWLCPLKLVTEYPAINSMATYLQAVIFITLGMGLLIILPVLTKKRTHCSLFCPLGAFQSLAGLINPYRVTIDKSKCTECGKCLTECPLFVITTQSIKQKVIPVTCSRCGKCMDVCPNGAINYSLTGIAFSTDDHALSKKLLRFHPTWLMKIVLVVEEIADARTLFVFSAILFGAIISGSMVTEAFVRIYHLLTTGTILMN